MYHVEDMDKKSTVEDERDQDSLPRLHVIQLSESVKKEIQNVHFRRPWYIRIDLDSNEEVDAVASSSPFHENDVLIFIDCNTGAGEFEACRFVGGTSIESEQRNEEVPPCSEYRMVRLLQASVESPVFPQQVIQSLGIDLTQEAQTLKLREMYEPIFEGVLKAQQTTLKLVDVMGGQDIVDMFWSNPDVGQDLSLKKNGDKEATKPCILLLTECTILS